MTDNIDAGEMEAKEMLTMLHDTGNSPQESLEVGILLSSDASQLSTSEFEFAGASRIPSAPSFTAFSKFNNYSTHTEGQQERGTLSTGTRPIENYLLAIATFFKILVNALFPI